MSSVKVIFGDEARRFSFKSQSFDDLVAMIKSLFVIQDNFILKYVDNENSHITIGSDIELKEAFHVAGSGVLKLFISKVDNKLQEEEKTIVVDKLQTEEKKVEYEQEEEKQSKKQEEKDVDYEQEKQEQSKKQEQEQEEKRGKNEKSRGSSVYAQTSKSDCSYTTSDLSNSYTVAGESSNYVKSGVSAILYTKSAGESSDEYIVQEKATGHAIGLSDDKYIKKS